MRNCANMAARRAGSCGSAKPRISTRWKADSAALAVEETADGSLVIEDPDYGTVHFSQDGSTEAEGRVVSPKEFTVAGEVTMLAAK